MEDSSSANAFSESVALFLLKVLFFRHVSPHVLISYNGLNFTEKVVTKMFNLSGTCPTISAPYYTATKGSLERANSTLVYPPQDGLVLSATLALFSGCRLFGLKISYHRVINISPFKDLYGQEPTMTSSILPIANYIGPGSAEA